MFYIIVKDTNEVAAKSKSIEISETGNIVLDNDTEMYGKAFKVSELKNEPKDFQPYLYKYEEGWKVNETYKGIMDDKKKISELQSLLDMANALLTEIGGL